MSTGRHLLQSAPFQPIFTHEGQAKTRKKAEKLFTEIQRARAPDLHRFPPTDFRPRFFHEAFCGEAGFVIRLSSAKSAEKIRTLLPPISFTEKRGCRRSEMEFESQETRKNSGLPGFRICRTPHS